MAKKEIKTDLWVNELLKEARINLTPQGCDIIEIDNALKTASKNGTGNEGYPEYCGVVKDYVIVIEDKADLSNHIKLDEDGNISEVQKDIKDYAVNGALYYGKHIIKNTTYKKAIIIGVSGNEKRHKITPIYVDETEYYRELSDVESFISFNEWNIDEYYIKEVLKESTDEEKETAEILKDAAELHEHLRNYGNIKDEEKPLIVSGILLALREGEFKNFNIDDLTGDTVKTDGAKIMDAIEANLSRSNVSPEVKKDKIKNQFNIIKESPKLNEVNSKLGETPLKFFTKFLNERLYKSFRYTNSSEDYLGRFYGEFMSYSGGSGQTLGIILTPKHITELFCELVDLKADDVVFDPCCGTGGFLVAAMHKMLNETEDENQKRSIRQRQLHGIEQRVDMFTIATTNMILRGDGKSNLINDDFLALSAGKLQLKQATVGLMNPPYSQGNTNNPELYEISFTEHLLDSLVVGGRCAVIVPQSCFTGKTKEEQTIKENILKHHTLEGVITLSKDTFYRVGTMPCIAIFTAGEPHPTDKICKFINFEDDGYEVSKHIGLLETEAAKDKKQHLLDVWFDRIEEETNYCVKTTITDHDEWLHSYYYFNEEIPTSLEFEESVNDALTFEFKMIMENKEYLYDFKDEISNIEKVEKLEEKNWKTFKIKEIFETFKGSNGLQTHTGAYVPKKKLKEGNMPRITVRDTNNGVDGFYNSNDKNYRVFENFISVSFLGSVFYHQYKASLDMKVHALILKDHDMNKYIAEFLKVMIKMNTQHSSYGNQLSSTDLPNMRILLPIDEDEKPDWEYMERFSKTIIDDKMKKYTGYFNKV